MKRQLAIDGRAIPEKDLLAQLLGIIDRLKDGMLILDNDHRIIYANAEIEQILLNQGLTGKNISEVNLGEIRPNFIYNLRIAIAERRKVSFIEYIKPRKMWYNVCIYTSTTLMLVVFQDMSDVERLKEQYKLTRYTIDNAQEYVMWVSMNGRISFVNGPTRRKLGYEMASKADYTIYDVIKAIPPDKWEKFRDRVIKEGSMTFESDVVDAHGKKITGDVTTNYVRQKEREYIVVFIRDISQRKRDEDELKSSKAQAELYLDLMCHDINNINQVGIGFLELAMEEEGLSEPIRDYLDRTMESLHRSTDLIANVKKLQSSKSGALRMRPISLDDVIGKSVAQYADHYNRDVDIHFESAGNCYVIGNDLLKDVFDNLIGNAIKHSNGPIAIDIGIGTVRENGHYFYKVVVEDDGPGIPDEVKGVIFSRGDVNKKRASGKGFGLYLVKTLVSDFKGRVWAEDRVPGDCRQGSKFVIMLPVASE